MPWPHLPGIIKVELTYGFGGLPSINIHFVLMRTPTSPIASEVLEEAADAFVVGYFDDWTTRAHEDWSVEAVKAIDWSLEDGEEFDVVTGLPFSGAGVTGDPCPPSVAMVASHRTGRTGRSRRGRSYVAGLAQAEIDGSNAGTGLTTDLVTMFGAIQDALALDDLDHVVYSLYTNGAPRAVPIATIINSTVVNSRVDTQRRRLP